MFSSTRPGEKTLREQGNDAFKEKEWDKAIELYTRAIEADYSPLRSVREQLATLYSNRAAAYVKRSEYHLAQFDVNCITRLKPGWFRGYERQAMIYEASRDFDDAAKSYDQAAEAATKDRLFRGTAEGSRQKATTMRLLAKGPDGKICSDWQYADTRDKFLARGESLDDRPAARIAILARAKITAGWNRFFDADIEGDATGAFDGLSEVIEGYLWDENAAHNFTSYADPETLTYKSFELTALENSGALNWDPVDPGHAEQRANEIVSIVREKGWGVFRSGKRWILGHLKNYMICAIRCAFVPDPEMGCLFVEGAIKITEKLQSEFPELKEGALKGDIALQLYRARRIAMSCRIWRVSGDGNYLRKNIEPLQALAERLFDDAVAKFTSIPQYEDPLLDYVHRRQPLAKALWSQAWCLRIRAHFPENHRHSVHPVAWLNQEMLRTAASLARKAEEYAPHDDELAPEFLEFALRCEILAGGLTASDGFAKSSDAERRRVFGEKFWGIKSRDSREIFQNRLLLRHVQTKLNATLKQIEETRGEDLAPTYAPLCRSACLRSPCKQPAVLLDDSADVAAAFEVPAVKRYMTVTSLK